MMIDPLDEKDFLELSRQYGVPVRILKQDYAALAALDLLSNTDLVKKLAFKGGTAIKRIFYPDARFSVDLDFIYLESVPLEDKEEWITDAVMKFFDTLRNSFEHQVSGSVLFKVVNEPVISLKWGTITIDYDMPGLSFFVRVDIEFSEMPPPSHIQEQIKVDPYRGEPGKINALPIEQILIDKIEALYDRTSPKDLWDISYLIDNGVEPRKPLREEVNIPQKKLLMAIDITSDTDWLLLRDYIPHNLEFKSLNEIKRKVIEFIKQNW